MITVAGVNASTDDSTSRSALRSSSSPPTWSRLATSIPIYPARSLRRPDALCGTAYTPQQYQTVTASPAANVTITPFANASVTYRQNIAYSPDAITMVVASLWMPPNEKVIAAARHNYDSLLHAFARGFTSRRPTSRLTV